ncbi:MAG: porin family protein [Phyllobacteriaceae bacterium]|nr:porin family protein [Phyllobacteriaceae bacterium]
MSRVTSAFALLAALAATAPAAAADLYGSPAPAASYGYSESGSGPAAQWTGAYAGPQVGYAWGRNGVHGPQGGIYAGVNTAVGSNIVVGAEAEVNVSGQERYTVFNSNLVKQSSDWNANVRARAGVAFDKVMPYATVGVAFADDTVKGLGANDTTTKVGYVVGMGVEGRLTDRISVKGELMHSGFGGTDHVVGYTTQHNDVSQTVVRTGAAYKF